MGSKAPPPSPVPEADPQKDDDSGLPRSFSRVVKTTPLQRIADALQVSPTVLYQPPNAIEAAFKSVGQIEADRGLDRECYALIHAFMRISDPMERSRILALVQALAEHA